MIKQLKRANGFEYLQIQNQKAQAKIALQGAHVFDYQSSDSGPLLWLSKSSFFEKGKAIRGGIPICWPWFGKNKENPSLAQHGFARTSLWELRSVKEPDVNTTVIDLELHDSKESQALWPYKFKLLLCVTVSDTLKLSLTTHNLDSRAFEITEALHSYFRVDDISNVTITGLENRPFVDQLKENRLICEAASIGIDKELDRIYCDTKERCIIHDGQKAIYVSKQHSLSSVIWNPWVDKAKQMNDFDDEGYRNMICLETANALHNRILLNPKEEHSITQLIEFER